MTQPDTGKIRDLRPAVLGVSLGLMMLFQVLGQGSPESIQASSLVILVIAFVIVISYKPTNSISQPAILLVGVLCVILIAGAVRSSALLGSTVLIRAGAVVLFLLLGLIYARRRDHAILERAFPVYALTLALVLVYVLIDNDRQFARLRGHLHPNLWGFVAATAAAGLLFLKASIAVRTIVIGFVLYMIAFEFQARGAFVMASLTVLAFGSWYIFSAVRKQKAALPYLTAFVMAAVALILAVFVFADLILIDLLQIHSTSRGLESGLTGRTEVWGMFLTFFAQEPLWGHGFDMSRFFAANYFGAYVAGEIASSHNSYLTILFDFGVSGIAIYTVLLILAFVGALRGQHRNLIPFLAIYLLMGVTESRPLNVGNSSGILFALVLPYYLARPLLSEALEKGRASGYGRVSPRSV